jgi:hypothetical protein
MQSVLLKAALNPRGGQKGLMEEQIVLFLAK